jgi:hypothetical protein
MKKLLPILLILLFGSETITAQVSEAQRKKDVHSIDNVITALYACISGEKGEPRDWDRFRNLMLPDSRLIPTSEGENGTNSYATMSPEEFIANASDSFVENGFYEYEIHREEQHYGRIVHLMSTYASKRSEFDAEPFNKGINSIQLFNDGERWWVVTIYWAHESEDNPIPERYQGN